MNFTKINPKGDPPAKTAYSDQYMSKYAKASPRHPAPFRHIGGGGQDLQEACD